MQDLLSQFRQQLSERESGGRLRSLKSVMPLDGITVLLNRKPLVNFGSNDYLGLASDPRLKQRSIEYTQRFGTGSTASRLICGNLEPYDYIERKLASLKGTEAALIMPTGFQTNLTVLAALTNSGSFVACDRLSHNSLLQGAQMSQGTWSRYHHNDHADLQNRMMKAESASTKWIVTESVFSMDGDRGDIASLSAIAAETGAGLFVDEAHATGVLGQLGMGLTAGQRGVTIAMGTFGKACGSFGAYIACSAELRSYLINFCSGFIYSTALPPGVLGAIDAALDLIPTMEKQRQQLLSNAEYLRTKLNELGFDTCGSTTQIVPFIIGTDHDAMSASAHLEDAGIFAPAIRPPTVPEGQARIRLSLTTLHTREHIDRIVSSMRTWRAH